MPGLVRKLLIFATADGLVLQPTVQKSTRGSQETPIKISYNAGLIGPVLQERKNGVIEANSLEVHGIVGLLKVSTLSFLISVSRREQVAVLQGKPIYCVSEVALIPLSSREDAEKAIVRARDSQRRREKQDDQTAGEYSEDDDQTISLADDASIPDPDPDPESPVDTVADVKDRVSGVAEDVIKKKGIYGRFTEKWFSNKGWNSDSRRSQGLSSEEDLSRLKSDSIDAKSLEQPTSSQPEAEAIHQELKVPEEQAVPAEIAHVVEPAADTSSIPLLAKLLTTTKIFFGSKNFYFSYDYNLSRSVSKHSEQSNSFSLHKTFDPIFYWNYHLANPFLEAGQEDFVLPLIQGFVGQREFTVSSQSSKTTAVEKNEQFELQEWPQSDDANNRASLDSYLLTLISRRSIHRAGLRYLRRGVDDDGWVANSVETEQIFSPSTWTAANPNSGKLSSYLQYRGSIPVLFSQSPYSLKPIPVFRGTAEANQAAFTLHFGHLIERYGRVQVASLVEKKGPEAKVGQYFEDLAIQAQKNNETIGDKLAFEWFDFHAVCKGMRFENVRFLFDDIKENLASFGWTEQLGMDLVKTQTGILRTNCMDCLDRTNVVQSACGRVLLETQLERFGITIDLEKDDSTSWFNTLWADNGDAISRQYAGTAALKGDFTRTRKRNIRGALNDFGLTLTRYYNNIVNDYFTQASMDYLLGNADESIFIDFEADMKSQDYAIDLRKVRQQAVETCVSICIEDPNEKLIAGWALQSPRVAGTLRSYPFEESILLLTGTALYFCRMDWTVEKVKSFERIELDSVEELSRGTYITSTFASREMDEKKNVGFVLRYSPVGKSLLRVNTRSLTSEEDGQNSVQSEKQKGKPAPDKLLAFKALPPRSYYTASNTGFSHPLDEEESIRVICNQIVDAVNNGRAPPVTGENTEEQLVVKEADIISLADAKKSTGYLETIGNSLKKLVWAS